MSSQHPWIKMLGPYHGKYRPVSRRIEERLIQEVLHEAKTNAPVSEPENNRHHWEWRWSQKHQASIQPSRFLRYQKQFVEVKDLNFEKKWYLAMIPDRFNWFLPSLAFHSGPGCIYEFGCGSGINIRILAKKYPNRPIYGLDWSMAAISRVGKIGKNTYGQMFDMLHPNFWYPLEPKSCVLTVGAIEQLAGNFQEFLEYLFVNRPAIVVHLEPIIELYDAQNPVDASAIVYHQARGYTTGFLPALKELEAKGRIELRKVHRTGLGSKCIEGYSEIVWRPV